MSRVKAAVRQRQGPAAMKRRIVAGVNGGRHIPVRRTDPARVRGWRRAGAGGGGDDDKSHEVIRAWFERPGPVAELD